MSRPLPSCGQVLFAVKDDREEASPTLANSLRRQNRQLKTTSSADVPWQSPLLLSQPPPLTGRELNEIVCGGVRRVGAFGPQRRPILHDLNILREPKDEISGA